MHLIQLLKELSLQPQSTQELRRLILDLGIRGRLTKEWREEHSEVESADVLLERIETAKAKLVEEKKIKKPKPLPTINSEELPFTVSDSWTWCRFGSLNKNIHYGYTASALKTRSGTRMLRITDIQNDKVDWPSVPDCNISDSDFPKYALKNNDILIARTCGTIGKSYLVQGLNVNSVFASYLIRAVPTQLVAAEFLKLFLGTALYWHQLRKKSKGTGQPNVNATSLKNLLMPLPPLAEQKAIVEIVDQLLAEVDALEQQLQQRVQLKEDYVTAALRQLTRQAPAPAWATLQPHFKSAFDTPGSVEQLRQAILQLAVQGKLTAPWRQAHADTEPASVLLEQIQAEKARLVQEKKIKKQKALPPIEAEEVPFELPEGWVWCRFESVVKEMMYGTSKKTNNNASDVPVLRMGNISSMGELILDKLKYISPEIDELPKLYLKNRDLVFNRTNSYALVGKSAVYDRGEQKMTLASYLIKVTPMIDFVDSYYLNLYIVSDACRKYQIEPQITAQTNQANFSGSKLKQILLPLPPLAEQKAIVALVDDLLGAFARLKAGLEAREGLLGDLMKASVREVRNRR